MMRMLRLAMVAFAVAAAPSIAPAQTLEQALAEAYSNNPTLNAERASSRATNEGVPQALSGFRPNLSASGDVAYESTNSRLANDLGVSATDKFPGAIELELTQNIFNGFGTTNSVRQAEANVRAARETLRNTEQNTLLDGVTAYMDVLRDAAVLNLDRNNIEVLREQLRQTEDRLEVGEVTRTDVEQARARLAAAQSQEASSQARLIASRAVYRQVIGSEPRRLSPARPIEKLLPKSLEAAIDRSMSIHPAILAARFNVESSARQVDVVQSALYPSVDVFGTVSDSYSPSDSINKTTNASVGARLSVPIYEGGLTYSQVRQAKEQLGQARLVVDITMNQVRAAVISAWGDFEAAGAQITAANAQVAAAEIALTGVREEALVGQRTTLDVLNAQQELLNARVRLVEAQRDRVVTSYALLSAIGELSAERLRLKVRLYDPMVHYRQVRNKWIGLTPPSGE